MSRSKSVHRIPPSTLSRRAALAAALVACAAGGVAQAGPPNKPVFATMWGSKYGQSPGQFTVPWGVQIDADGHVVVIDEGRNTGEGRVQKFTGKGSFVSSFVAQGQVWPRAVLVLDNGQILTGDNDGTILRFDAGGGLLNTYGDPAITGCNCIALAQNGEFLVADASKQRVARLAADGTYLGIFADTFPATPDSFAAPAQIAVAGNGDVYVADAGNNRIVVFDAAGTFKSAFGEEGGLPGQFRSPIGVAVAFGGDLFVTDSENHRVQRLTANGAYVVDFGKAGKGKSQFDTPLGITVDPVGNVYVADGHNHRIQKFAPPAAARRPDARIRVGAAGPFTGDDEYNKSAKNQSVATLATPGVPVEFTFSIQNDGTEPDFYKLKCKAATGGHEVVWKDGGDDVTAEVEDGDFVSRLLVPGETQELTIEVTLKTGTKPGKELTRKAKLKSQSIPAAKDAVKFTAEAQ